MRCILQSQVLHGLQGSIFVSPQRARVSDVVSPSYLVGGGGGGGARGLWQKGGGVISRRWLLLCSWLAVSCASDLVERLRVLALAEGKSPSPHMPSDGDRRCYKHNAYVSIACVYIYTHHTYAIDHIILLFLCQLPYRFKILMTVSALICI